MLVVADLAFIKLGSLWSVIWRPYGTFVVFWSVSGNRGATDAVCPIYVTEIEHNVTDTAE